jgi:bifunctional DNA-binding transcriptional regulator/antitoxin component of YhaV-PrlF toxin-antitoxin module
MLAAVYVMIITVKDKMDLVVPPSVQREAGIRAGDRLEFKVSGGVINIILNHYRPAAAAAHLLERRCGTGTTAFRNAFPAHCQPLYEQAEARSTFVASKLDGRSMRITSLADSTTKIFPEESTASADGFSSALMAGPPSPE